MLKFETQSFSFPFSKTKTTSSGPSHNFPQGDVLTVEHNINYVSKKSELNLHESEFGNDIESSLNLH